MKEIKCVPNTEWVFHMQQVKVKVNGGNWNVPVRCIDMDCLYDNEAKIVDLYNSIISFNLNNKEEMKVTIFSQFKELAEQLYMDDVMLRSFKEEPYKDSFEEMIFKRHTLINEEIFERINYMLVTISMYFYEYIYSKDMQRNWEQMIEAKEVANCIWQKTIAEHKVISKPKKEHEVKDIIPMVYLGFQVVFVMLVLYVMVVGLMCL